MLRTIFLFLFLPTIINCYTRKPCARRSQFQFPKCYVPPMDESISIHEASFLFAHDAGTGYIEKKKALHWFYSKTQEGSAYRLLNDGARALDVRPKLLSNGTVILQHGVVDIAVTLETMVQDAIQWCNENHNDNEGELVLLLTNDFQYEAYDGDEYSGTTALAAVYESLGVAYYSCDAIYGLTVGQVMELAKLEGGGYLIALDGHNRYGSLCGKANWVQDQLVTCYPGDGSICTNKRGTEPLASLKEYVLGCANNEATDDYSTLGPPASLETYPFNEIQGMWQVDTSAILAGLRHVSSLLGDNKKSNVNREMAKLIHSGAFDSISLFAVDNVAVDGLALLSLLRTRCGQSTSLPDDVCGPDLPRPTMMHLQMSQLVYWSIVGFVAFVLGRGIWRSHGHDILSEVKNWLRRS